MSLLNENEMRDWLSRLEISENKIRGQFDKIEKELDDFLMGKPLSKNVEKLHEFIKILVLKIYTRQAIDGMRSAIDMCDVDLDEALKMIQELMHKALIIQRVAKELGEKTS